MLAVDRSWTRPGPTASQARNDVLIAVAAALISVASVEIFRSANGATTGWKGIEAYAWFALAGMLLIWRRRFPLTILVAQSVVFIIVGTRLLEIGVVFTIQIIMFAALYTAWAWSQRPRALIVVSAIVVVAMFGWLIWQLADTMPKTGPKTGLLEPEVAIIVYSLIINVVYFFGAMAWGQTAWRSARQRVEIVAQAERERSLQVDERERAVQLERVRIARDLHDVVAHHVSGIGVQAAGAGRVLESKPVVAREALGRIEKSSRQAVEQMHQLVGLLRSDDEGGVQVPQPGLGQLHELTTDSSERPTVAFTQVGTPFEIPSTVETSLFRIAQEAVTNSRRHARAQHVSVTLRYLDAAEDRPPAVEVEVVDDGTASAAPTTSGGYGLAGIRERASVLGGLCEIGPRPDGGFRVRAQIPVTS